MTDPKLNIKVTVNGAEAQKDLGRLTGQVDQFGTVTTAAGERAAVGFGRARQGVESISTQLDRAQGALVGFFGVQASLAGVEKVTELADSYNNLQGRIKLAAGEGANYQAISAELFDISQRTQQPLEAIGTLYSKTAQAVREAGLNTQQTLAFTETLAQGFRVSGATSAEAAGAIQQLAQGLQAGALRGDEFNSVNEQGGRIAQALADGLGVTRGELRGLAEQGALTSEAVTRALASQAGKIAEEYNQLPQSISGAVTRLQNELLRYVGATDKTTGSSNVLAGAIKLVADNVDALDQILAVAAAGGAIKLTSALQAQVKTALDSIAASKAQADAAAQNALAAREVAAAELQAAEGKRLGTAASYEIAAADQASARAAVATADANVIAARAAFESATADLAATQATEARVVAQRNALLAGEQVLVAEKAATAAKQQAAVATTELSAATQRLVLAQEAEAVAAGRAAAAQTAASGATSGLLKELGTLSGVLNVAFAGFIGFEIGSYLHDEFETVRIAGARLTEGLLIVAETARFAFDVLSSPLDAGADYDEYVANLKRIHGEFNQIAADATDAARAQVDGAAKAGEAQVALTPKIDGVAAAIKKATGETIALDGAGDKAGKSLSQLGSEQLITGIGRLEGELRTAKDELAVFEDQMNSLSGEAFIEFEKANRDAFDKAVTKVKDLENAIETLREAQFKQLGIDAEAVLTGIDAEAKKLLTTFGSVSANAQTDARLIQAAFESLLKKLDTPQELEALKTSLAGVKDPAFDAAAAIGEIEKKLQAIQPEADKAAKELEAAFQLLGVTSTAAVNDAASKTETAFNLIRQRTGDFSRESAQAFGAYADASIKAAAAQGDVALAAEIAGLRITAAGLDQLIQLDDIVARYSDKGSAAENSANRAVAANGRETASIQQIIDGMSRQQLAAEALSLSYSRVARAARQAYLDETSLVNARDRIDNLGGVNVDAASIDGRGAVGFGVDGINKLQAVQAEIRRAIEANQGLLDTVRAQQIASERDVATAQALIANARGQASRLATVTGSEAPEARALSRDLVRQIDALQREIAEFRTKPPAAAPAPTPRPLGSLQTQMDQLALQSSQAQARGDAAAAARLDEQRAALMAVAAGKPSSPSPSPSPTPAPAPTPTPRVTPPTTPERIVVVRLVVQGEDHDLRTDPLTADRFLVSLQKARKGST